MKLATFGIVLLTVVGAASATTTTAPSPYAGKMGPTLTNPPSAGSNAEADDSSGMRRGTIEKVNVAGNTFHMYGQRLSFDARRVKVFNKDGKPASIYALRAGSKLRFTMDPTDPSHRRVAVIYID